MNAEHNEDVAEHLRQYEADRERERKEAERAAVDNVERMMEKLSTKYKVTRQST
jgi:F0F1-type ATP synthase gamma subunit